MHLIWCLLSNFYLNMFRASLWPSSGGQDCVLPHMAFCTVTRKGEPYAVVHNLLLLKMGILMPETCWDRSFIINTRFVASCWFLSLHPRRGCNIQRLLGVQTRVLPRVALRTAPSPNRDIQTKLFWTRFQVLLTLSFHLHMDNEVAARSISRHGGGRCGCMSSHGH